MTCPEKPKNQFDSPWKEMMELYLRPLLHYCFPKVAAIDWNSPREFLDKELQEIVRDAALGKQFVDKQVKVKLRNGGEEWILVLLEVQHRSDPQFLARVFRYYHRICDRFGRRVVTLVILADENPAWRPTHYETELLGCRGSSELLILRTEG